MDPDPEFVGKPLEICFCQPEIGPKATADYPHFVRIIGHEMEHVPQHSRGAAGGLVDQNVYEFEGYFFEACHEGRQTPALTDKQRINHANTALDSSFS